MDEKSAHTRMTKMQRECVEHRIYVERHMSHLLGRQQREPLVSTRKRSGGPKRGSGSIMRHPGERFSRERSDSLLRTAGEGKRDN